MSHDGNLSLNIIEDRHAMTRLLSIMLGLFVGVACACGAEIILDGSSSIVDIPPKTVARGKPIEATKDKEGKLLYSGRTLEAWLQDLQDKDLLIREEAIEILAQIGKPARSATAELQKFLKDDNRNLRLRAALALWKIGGDPRGVPAILAEGMKEASSAVKRESLLALGTIGPDAAVATNAVVECLEDPDYNLRNQAATTLQQLGPAALPALLGNLKSKSPTVRLNVLRHLNNFMVASLGKEQVPTLTAQLRDDSLPCRVEAARILWGIGQTGAPIVAVLLEGVKAPGGDLQATILHTLQSAPEKPRTLLPVLEVCLEGTNVYTRIQAARVLFGVEKKPQRVLPIYLEVLRDPSNQNRSYTHYAISALVELGADAHPALPRLLELMKTNGYYAPYDMKTLLANIGTPSIGPLVELLQTTLPANTSSYEAAIGALGSLGQPAAKAVLPLLSNRDANVRIRAIRVVSTLGVHARDALPKLIDAIQDPSIPLRDAALQALGNLGDVARSAAPRLIEMAKDRNIDLRILSLRTLISIRPEAKDIVPLCLPLLRDPNALIRQTSLQLLVSVDPDHKAILPAALRLLDDPATRTPALDIFGTLGSARIKAIPRLVKLLEDTDENTRRSAVYTLGQIGPDARAAAPALLNLLDSSNAETVNAVAQALYNIKPEVSICLPKVIVFLEKCKDTSAGPLLTMLGDAGKSAEKAFPTILAILEDSTRLPQIRANAAVTLARISRDKAAKEALLPTRKLLLFADQKLIVARALFTLDDTDKEAIAIFESQLSHASSALRSTVCSVLGQIGPPAKRFLPRIREQCKDKEYSLRCIAAMAVYRISKDAREALPTLEAMLEDTTQPYSKGYAAFYLGELGLGARGVLPKLQALRSSGDAYGRSQAAGAIKKIEKAIADTAPPKAPDPDENP